MRMRGVLVLATIAALLGAPSLASAAGNTLATPTASPSAGTVETVFTFRVTYDGQFSATAVTMSVAGLHLPLALVAGTPLSGTWGVSTPLPAGTWTPTFLATPLRGNTTSITGGPITVAGLPGAPPTPTATVSTSSSPGSGGEVDSGQPFDPGDPAPDPAPAGDVSATVAPSTEGAPAATDASSPAGSDGGTAPDGPSGTTSSPTPEQEGDPPAAPAAREPEPEGDASAEPRIVPAADRREASKESGTDARDGLLGLVLFVGLSGVAVVAIIGTGLLLAARRRSGKAEPAPASQLADTESLLQRRIVRRAKVRLTDDPIVTAMGVDDQVDARRRRHAARRSAGGPDERPGRGRG
ncbi:MAG TPA: hypothetical protein VF365_00405 [Candidatus Limnocylindria bacterium]